MQLLRTALAAALLVSSVLAQGITINTPAPGTILTPGTNITVQIGTNIYIQNLETISIAIGLQSCPNNNGAGCTTADESIGTILYTGPFNPTFGPEYYSLYQDYVVTIPASTPAGLANLAAVDFYLVGAGQAPSMAFSNSSMTVA